MEGLRVDHWQTVSKFLTIREMGRLMCVSRGWYHLWKEDRMWVYQKERMCSIYPDLRRYFEGVRTSKQFSKKKRKTEISKPQSGIWSVFKRYMYAACTCTDFKKLCQKEKHFPLVTSVAKSMIPCPELITLVRIDVAPVKTYRRELFRIVIQCPGIPDVENQIRLIFYHGGSYMKFECYRASNRSISSEYGMFQLFSHHDLFNELIGWWRRSLFQINPYDISTKWRPEFINFMQNKK